MQHDRVAIVGARGQLGSALVRLLGGRAVELTRNDINLADQDNVRGAIQAARASLVINTAAYNFVDQAERTPDEAWAVNRDGPRHLALACAAMDAPLVHVSTDYVFGGDGRRTPYTEGAAPCPVSVYGQTKAAGELAVAESCPRHLIVRTCGLYGEARSPGKGNFVKAMLRLATGNRPVRVVNDQHCTPTFVDDLAAAILALVAAGAHGIYHATNSGATTWYGMAEAIFRNLGYKVDLQPISSAEYGAAAARPAYSVLDTAKFAGVIGAPLRPWGTALAEYLDRIAKTNA